MDVLDRTGVTRTARELVESLDLRAPRHGARPRVVAAMIAALDGRATIGGTSVALGHPQDRALLRELRTGADAVLAGSTTLKAERYATLLDADQRGHRLARGLTAHPILATVDRAAKLSGGDVPIFAEAQVPIRVYTESAGHCLDAAAADVQVIALGRGQVDFPAVLADLHERDGVRGVSCEGGPRLLRELIAQGCLDDLLLTVAPLLASGDGPTMLAGEALAPPADLRLVQCHRADEHLFLHYQPRGSRRP